MWFSLAAARGDKEAAELRDSLEKNDDALESRRGPTENCCLGAYTRWRAVNACRDSCLMSSKPIAKPKQDRNQRQRVIKAACEHGASADEDVFDANLKQIAKALPKDEPNK